MPSFVLCQSWENIYENGTGNSVQETSDGGYIITGKTLIDNLHYNVLLIKVDEFGDTLWTKNYGEQYDDYGYSVQQTTDGGYILTGSIESDTADFDVYLIKTDENGDTLWTKNYGGNSNDFGFSVQQTTDDGYIITGIYNSISTSEDLYLIKTNENGDLLWSKTYGSDENDWGLSVKQTVDGGFIVTGVIDLNTTKNDQVYLIKTDENGDTLWTKNYGGNYNDYGYSVQQTTDGGYIIAGILMTNSVNGDEVYLIKTNSSGDTIWTRSYGGDGLDYGYSVQQTIDEGYIITGLTQLNSSYYDVFLIKANSNGDTLWTRIIGGQYDYEYGNSVKQTTDGGYIIVGTTNAVSSGMYSVYLIKTDYEGNIVSTFEIPFPITKRKLVKLVDFSGKEITKPYKNVPFIEIYDNGTTKKKMIIE